MVGKSYSDKLAASAVDLYNITGATVRGITLDLGVSVAHYPHAKPAAPRAGAVAQEGPTENCLPGGCQHRASSPNCQAGLGAGV